MSNLNYVEDNGFNYTYGGKGNPIIVLHGLMGGLGNFKKFLEKFPSLGYQVFMPELPIYSSSLLDTNVKFFAKYINNIINFLGLKNVILVGNSLGGHVALVHAKLFPSQTKALVLTGSSGLYENAMGDTYPRRGDYEFIKKKTQSFNETTLSLKKLSEPQSKLLTLDLANAPDIAQTIAVTCLGLEIGCNLTGLHTLKIKETDRLVALQNEIKKLGTSIEITDNSLHLKSPNKLNSSIHIATYNDHRMAMAFAPLGLKTQLFIDDADVVSKSYPDFWSDLSALGFELN